MDVTLKIWRQAGPEAKGEMKTYPISGVEEDMSFLEMLDYLNEQLIDQGIEPVVFDHDCREGICGMCSMVINGRAHGLFGDVLRNSFKCKNGGFFLIESRTNKLFS